MSEIFRGRSQFCTAHGKVYIIQQFSGKGTVEWVCPTIKICKQGEGALHFYGFWLSYKVCSQRGPRAVRAELVQTGTDCLQQSKGRVAYTGVCTKFERIQRAEMCVQQNAARTARVERVQHYFAVHR